MKPLKEKISITIDNDVLAKLKERAELDDRSLSQYINIILKQQTADIKVNRLPLDVGVKEKDMDIYRIYTALPE